MYDMLFAWCVVCLLVDQTLEEVVEEEEVRRNIPTWWKSFKTLAQTCCNSFRLVIVSSVFWSIDSSWVPT